MRRIIALTLVLATVLSLFTVLGVSGMAAAETFSACVGDVYENMYVESYGEYLSKLGANTSGKRSFSGFAWRGDETISRIDLLTRATAYDDVELVKADFVSDAGDVLAAENISFTYLDAVTINETMISSNKNGYKMYDVISDDTVRDLKAKSLYCAWVSIKVPENTRAGVYTATLSAVSGDTVLAEFDYTLTVYDIVQPELQSDVDLWMWPYNSVRYYSGLTTEELYETEDYNASVDWTRLWNTRLDEKYFPALESELELYAKAGGDAVFAQVNEKNRTNGDPYPSLVKWTRKKDGTFSFDYTDFDKWVELNFKHGIDKQIKCYDIGQWKYHIVYFDEAKDKVEAREYYTSDKFWREQNGAFLEDFIKHLDEKGWFDITYIALDEKDYNITKNVIDLVKQYKNKDGKTLKVATAVASWHCEELFDDIQDLSIAYGMMCDKMERIMEERAAKGYITTIYTCGPQGTSMMNDPGQSAESIHQTYKIGATGFLRWALQKYNADPYFSSYNYVESLCSGDMYLIYPSKDITKMKAYSTPRYETLCEGLRDIEQARYLEANMKELSAQSKDAIMRAPEAADFRNVLDEYSVIYCGEVPSFTTEQDVYELSKGESVNVLLSDDGAKAFEGQTALDYIDDSQFTYADDSKWVGEGQYFWLFLYSTNHYSRGTNAASNNELSYEFTFYGDAVEIYGSVGRGYGQALVTIDGEEAGYLDGYAAKDAKYSKIYACDGLVLGEHKVVVQGMGTKNPAANGYQLQVDYALAKEHKGLEFAVGNTDVATVDENGKVTAVGAGTTTLTIKCGDLLGSAKITVKADADALTAKKNELSALDLSKYPANVKTEIEAAIALANSAVTDDEIQAAYDALLVAENVTVSAVKLVSKPIMLNFVVGEYFSAKGGLLELARANGDVEYLPTANDMASGYSTTYAGSYTVTLTVYGKEVSYDITVSEVPDAAEAFTDVKAGQWYESAVNYAVGHGLFNGVSGNRFAPNDVMNRGMLVTVLYRMEGSPAIDGIENPFNDVKEKDWYYAPVLWAAANGIVGGVGSGKYAPTDSLTREQLATILFRYSSVRKYNTEGRGDLSSFPDAAKVSSWAIDAYSWAIAEGLIGGNNIGGVAHLDPAGKATRAQVATILMRFQASVVNA